MHVSGEYGVRGAGGGCVTMHENMLGSFVMHYKELGK